MSEILVILDTFIYFHCYATMLGQNPMIYDLDDYLMLLRDEHLFIYLSQEKEGTGVDLSNLLTITSGSLHVDESQGMQIDPDSPREGPSASR